MSCFPTAAFTRVNVYARQLRFDYTPQVEACSHYDFQGHQKPSERPARMTTPTSALVTKVGVSLAVNVTAIGGYLAFDKVAAADQNS
ncbi:MAG: hypothetical protein ABGZ35_26915 [Planctomycetaceae bacterium]